MKISNPRKNELYKLKDAEEFISHADRSNGSRKVTKIRLEIEINASKWLTVSFFQTLKIAFEAILYKVTDAFSVKVEVESDFKTIDNLTAKY